MIRCIVNNKLYIGKAVNIRKRWGKHLSAAKNKNPKDYFYIHEAINKHGPDNFIIEEITNCETESEALKIETNCMKLYNTLNKSVGYNLKESGIGTSGRIVTDETKRKISIANTGKKRTKETKIKMGLAHIGGKRTEATKQKMRESRAKQAPMSDESKKKLSETKKKLNLKMSDETKAKHSITFRGEGNNSALLNERQVLEIRKLRGKKGDKRMSLKDLAKKFNVSSSTIQDILYRKSWKHI
jgi:group I intron endonuclease